MDVKELIQSIEGNYHQYNQLLTQIETQDESEAGSSRSVEELVHTLSQIHSEVVDFRLKKILVEKNPYLPAIQVEKISTHRNAQSNFNQAVEAFLSQRWSLIKLLHSLPNENWNRTGLHANEGHVTFKELVRRMVEKDKQTIGELSEIVVKSP